MQVTSLEWIFTSSPATMLIAPLKSTYSFAICSGSLPSSMSERKIVFVSFASTFRNCIICRVVAVSRWLSRPANLISKNNGKAFSAASDEIIRHILPNLRRVKLKARKGSFGLCAKKLKFPFHFDVKSEQRGKQLKTRSARLCNSNVQLLIPPWEVASAVAEESYFDFYLETGLLSSCRAYRLRSQEIQLQRPQLLLQRPCARARHQARRLVGST